MHANRHTHKQTRARARTVDRLGRTDDGDIKHRVPKGPRATIITDYCYYYYYYYYYYILLLLLLYTTTTTTTTTTTIYYYYYYYGYYYYYYYDMALRQTAMWKGPTECR